MDIYEAKDKLKDEIEFCKQRRLHFKKRIHRLGTNPKYKKNKSELYKLLAKESTRGKWFNFLEKHKVFDDFNHMMLYKIYESYNRSKLIGRMLIIFGAPKIKYDLKQLQIDLDPVTLSKKIIGPVIPDELLEQLVKKSFKLDEDYFITKNSRQVKGLHYLFNSKLPTHFTDELEISQVFYVKQNIIYDGFSELDTFKLY